VRIAEEIFTQKEVTLEPVQADVEQRYVAKTSPDRKCYMKKLEQNCNRYRLRCYLGEDENLREELRLIVDALDNSQPLEDARAQLIAREIEIHARRKVVNEEISELFKERGKWAKKSKL